MEKRRGIRIAAAVLLWIVTVLWCCFIYSMSAETGEESGDTSGRVVEGVADIFVPSYDDMSTAEKNVIKSKLSLPIRKLGHFAEFAVLGGLLLSSLGLTFGKRLKQLLLLGIAFALGVVYAALDELHQASVPGRAPAVTDVLIDSSGVLVGVLGIALIIYLIERKRRRLIS